MMKAIKFNPITQAKSKSQETPNTTHGGARPGAGLPKIVGGKRVLVTLTPKNVETAKNLGGGNVSKGIRAALDKVKK